MGKLNVDSTTLELLRSMDMKRAQRIAEAREEVIKAARSIQAYDEKVGDALTNELRARLQEALRAYDAAERE